jgi:hypothetical protein
MVKEVFCSVKNPKVLGPTRALIRACFNKENLSPVGKRQDVKIDKVKRDGWPGFSIFQAFYLTKLKRSPIVFIKKVYVLSCVKMLTRIK